MHGTTARTVMRRVRDGDAASLLRLRAELLHAGLELDCLPDTLSGMQSLVADGSAVVMCAEQDDEPVGVAYLEAQPDGRARLHALAVAPHARGQGVGSSLLTNALFAVLPTSALSMLVRPDDEEALEWALRRGFREVPSGTGHTAGQLIELELRLDAPAHGCGCGDGGRGCGEGGCKGH